MQTGNRLWQRKHNQLKAKEIKAEKKVEQKVIIRQTKILKFLIIQVNLGAKRKVKVKVKVKVKRETSRWKSR